MQAFLSGFHVVQAGLGLYTGVYSYTSITKLQKYEEQSEKAAEYSNTAAHQLHKTRTTQTSGALTILCSVVSCGFLIITPPNRQSVGLVICLANTVAGAFAYQHIKNFWNSKMKVPFVKDYSDAITTSNQMRSLIGYLGLSWLVATLVYFSGIF